MAREQNQLMHSRSKYTWESVALFLGLSIEDTKSILMSSAITEYCPTIHIRRTLQVLDGYLNIDEADIQSQLFSSFRQAISTSMYLLSTTLEQERVWD